MTHAVFRDGKVHVCAELCPTCVFRPGNLMKLHSGRLAGMVREAQANQSCIPCHERLEKWTGVKGQDACCRGFFDRYPTQPLQLAERLGLVEFVDPAKDGSPPR